MATKSIISIDSKGTARTTVTENVRAKKTSENTINLEDTVTKKTVMVATVTSPSGPVNLTVKSGADFDIISSDQGPESDWQLSLPTKKK